MDATTTTTDDDEDGDDDDDDSADGIYEVTIRYAKSFASPYVVRT